MHKNKSVNVKQFAMAPAPNVPRSAFRMEQALKTSFDTGYLVPIYCEPVLPGDHFNVHLTAFARLATPIFPFMDNLWAEVFFFSVPLRLVWDNFRKFMGEQDNPADSISYTVPQMVSKVAGYDIAGLHDYFGLPTAGQVAGGATVSHSSLPLRAYNLIWKEWFRDENLQNSPVIDKDDGPDLYTDYVLRRRGKRHDYLTSCLPWTQKGTAVSMPLSGTVPLGGFAAVHGIGISPTSQTTGGPTTVKTTTAASTSYTNLFTSTINVLANGSGNVQPDIFVNLTTPPPGDTAPFADLSTATAFTINALRQSVQIQEFLERDARGGTRYIEKIWSHFRVRSPDARLQRPEYLGGGRWPISVNPIAQTSSTDATTPQGNLAAMGSAVMQGGFNQSFTEHGYVIGLIHVGADLTYQQGLRRHWSYSTQYDWYWPEFAHLGEQSVLNKEIYVRGDANDNLVFGYQERYAEWRYTPSQITGLMRSTAASTIDKWHLAQKFTALPTLGDAFIQDTPPVDRVVAAGSGANAQQLIMDVIFINKAARPIPMYGVPASFARF